MKGLISNTLVLILGLFIRLNASNISGNMDAYQMGAWAMSQHNSICHIIYPAIEAGKINVLNMSKAEALKILSQRVVVFLQTDPDDPANGHDTFFSMILSNRFESFTKDATGITVKINSNLREIKLAPTFTQLLNAEEKIYFDQFAVNNKIEYNAIPHTCRKLLLHLNLKLYNESSRPNSITYKNDSLKSKLNNIDKQRRGTIQVVAFISTNPNDPTIGYDSSWTESYESNISDSNKYLGLDFVMSNAGTIYMLQALSCTFETYTYKNGIGQYYLEPYGFISFILIKNLTMNEKKLIEYCIRFTMNGRLKYNDINLKSYLNEFNIKPLTYDRKINQGQSVAYPQN